jgi:general stress protein YciG
MTKPRGTAAMDPETRKRIAASGGRAVSANREHMAAIGRKGGLSALAAKGPGYFSELGKKGGTQTQALRVAKKKEVMRGGPGEDT